MVNICSVNSVLNQAVVISKGISVQPHDGHCFADDEGFRTHERTPYTSEARRYFYMRAGMIRAFLCAEKVVLYLQCTFKAFRAHRHANMTCTCVYMHACFMHTGMQVHAFMYTRADDLYLVPAHMRVRISRICACRHAFVTPTHACIHA